MSARIVQSEGLRTISYGGGVQSTALLVLAAQGKIDFPLAIFSNVGDGSEHPASLSYVREIAIPWGAKHGIEVIEVRRKYRDGTDYEGIDEFLTNPDRKGIPIPMYGSEAGAPGGRSCTAEWKIKTIGRVLRSRGASADVPATVAVGISVDEIERAGRGRNEAWERRVYPLLELGLTRADCEQVIAKAGLPVPPKSSCFFCPFHSRHTWAKLRRDEPVLFRRAQEIEDTVNEKRRSNGKTPMYLTKTGKRLSDAVTQAQDTLPGLDGPEGCDEGYCWT